MTCTSLHTTSRQVRNRSGADEGELAERALLYAQAMQQRFLSELAELIRFPSVSAQPRRKEDIKRCADWLAQHLRSIGLENVVVTHTRGHPIVTANWLHAPDRPTLLIYGHYDVQPPGPLSEWNTPPFTPVVRNGYVYGRGASDDKGQLFVHVKAIESYLRSTGVLPLNVKCIFEGEEEIGSKHLAHFLRRHPQLAHADGAVISDMRILGVDRPAITESLRGVLSVELEVQGQKRDLHSGIYGGAIHNPLQALCEIIAKLHDARGKVAIPGFYAQVREPLAKERLYMARIGPTDEEILRHAGAKQAWGDSSFSLYERVTTRPALTINRICSGDGGASEPAVIPSKALAQLEFRLAPDQSPDAIERLLQRFIAQIAPSTMQVNLRTVFSAPPVVAARNSFVVRAAVEAYAKGFNTRPVFMRSGGAVPVIPLLQQTLRIPIALMGFALPDDGFHAPNERFALTSFLRGIATSIHFLRLFGSAPIRAAQLQRPVRHTEAKRRAPNIAAFLI